MRIQRLHIDGFGHFSDYSADQLNGDIVIFQGANEAGKSTLLSFVQSVLFGFQRNRPGLPVIDALSGGRHGGRIVVIGADGQPVTIERYAGTHGGQVTISNPDGSTGNASDLSRLLGMPAEVYCNVFSFDLKQLFEAGSLNDRSITTHLYGAGLGTEHLLSVLGGLKDRGESIFLSSRGQVQRVPQLLNELQSVESKLAVVKQDAQSYHSHRQRLGEIESTRANIRQQIETSRRQQQHANNLLRSLDDWSRYRAIDAQVAALPEIDAFPEDGVARLDETEARIVSAETEERRAGQLVDDLQAETECPLADAALADQRMDVEQLRSRLASFNDAIGTLQRVTAEANTATQSLNDGISALGQGWDSDRLASFDTSIPEQDAVANHHAALERAEKAVREAELEVQSATTEQQIAETKLAGARRQLRESWTLANDHEGLQTWERAYREARTARQEYTRRWQHYRDQQSNAPAHTAGPATGQPSRVVLAGGMVIVGAVLVLAGMLAGGTALVVGAVAGAITILTGIGLMLRGPQSGPQHAATAQLETPPVLQRAQEEYDAARSRLIQTLQDLGGGDPDQADSLLDDVADRLNDTRIALEQINNANADVTMRQHRLDATNHRLEQAISASAEEGARWREWLVARGLSESLSPNAVTTIFTSVSRLRQQQEQLAALNQQRHKLASLIQHYRSCYVRVVDALGERPVGTIQEVGAAAGLIIERYDNLRNELTLRQALNDQLQSTKRDHEERLAELDRLHRQRTDLLRRGRTDDSELFRTRASQFAERQAAIREQREILARIQRYSGTGDAWQQFRDELETTSAEALDQHMSGHEQRIDELEEELSLLDREHGERSAEIVRLAGDDTAVELRAKRQLLQEQLREAADEWSSYTIARTILDRARQRYEEERQPEVLRTAERYFHSITGGRYTGLINPIGSDDVQVVRSDDHRMNTGQLSRGTREQLYLSLRFGLIAGFGKTSAHLPVIVDDILVNFDPDRARATAAAFAEVSKTNQILVFTCHPSTIDHFRQASPDVQVVELGREVAVAG